MTAEIWKYKANTTITSCTISIFHSHIHLHLLTFIILCKSIYIFSIICRTCHASIMNRRNSSTEIINISYWTFWDIKFSVSLKQLWGFTLPNLMCYFDVFIILQIFWIKKILFRGTSFIIFWSARSWSWKGLLLFNFMRSYFSMTELFLNRSFSLLIF